MLSGTLSRACKKQHTPAAYEFVSDVCALSVLCMYIRDKKLHNRELMEIFSSSSTTKCL